MMRIITGLSVLCALGMPLSSALAQEHSGHFEIAQEDDETPRPATDHQAMDHQAMDHETMDHAEMDHQDMPQDTAAGEPSMDHAMHGGHGTAVQRDAEDTPGDMPPPSVPDDHAADGIFPLEVMERSRAEFYGDMRFTAVSIGMDMLEYRAAKGTDGYAFEGEAWYGGDLERAVLSYEGEGEFGEAPETVEVSAYWRQAINPWFNLQMGLRHDVRPDPERSYAMIGIEGLAPYWIETRLRAFVSEKGDVHLRAEASYDQRITQRLVLEPEIEVDLALQDVPELGIRGGMDGVELSARLRYEIARNFAPYVGLSWERKYEREFGPGDDEGKYRSSAAFLAGLRFWF